jgi:hypothetical protein
MSGVAKDDPNTTKDGEQAAAEAETPAVATEPAHEGDARAARKVAPHLRVVSDNSDEAGTVRAAPAMRAGSILRQSRENLGLTLEQVSKDTRITLSHLRAIEDMTPSLLGAKVYAEGHIRTYARHLKLNSDEILNQYRGECAILADPVKTEIEPVGPVRKTNIVGPLIGVAVVAALGAAGYYFVTQTNQPGSDAARETAAAPSATAAAPVETAGPTTAAPLLRIVALRRARLEIRGADGTKFLARYLEAGEDYPPRVGAGWTVTTNDGGAFEWRLGDASLGLFAPEGGPVYAQSVDAALTREPLPMSPEALTPSPDNANEAAPITGPTAGAPGAATASAPVNPRPRPRPPAAPAAAAQPPAQAAAPAQPPPAETTPHAASANTPAASPLDANN